MSAESPSPSLAGPAAAPFGAAGRVAHAPPARPDGDGRALEASDDGDPLHLTFEQAAVGIVRVGVDGAILDANPGFCRIVGQPRGALVGRKVLELTHPDDVALDAAEAARVAAGAGDGYTVEKRYRHGAGGWVWASLTASAVRDGRGRVQFAIGVVQDISERKAAEAALRASEAERDRLLDREHELRRGAEQARDRMGSLQALTAALASATTAAGVGEVVTAALLEATGAAAGGLGTVLHAEDDGPSIRYVHMAGYPDAWSARYDGARTEAGTPMADAVRTAQPVYLEAHADWERRYPLLSEVHRAGGFEAAAAVPCVHDAGVVGALVLSFRGPHAFAADERAFLLAVTRQAAVALERARLAGRAARQAQRAAFLAEASRALSTPLDYDETLRLLPRLVIPELADFCMVYRLGADGLVHRVARGHHDPAQLEVLDLLERDYPLAASSDLPAARVFRTGEAIFAPAMTIEALRRAAPDARYLELVARLRLASGITLPLVARGRALGALALARAAGSGRHHDADDFETALAFAERAALALDTTRLLAEARQARREAEEARELAEQASRAKGEFLAVMSHELRTPLNAIGGYAELLELGVRGPVTPEQREDLGRIQRSQRHLLGLINQVLSYARVESGTTSYALRDVPLDETLRGAEPLVAPQLRAKGLTFAYEPAAAPLVVRADEDKLRQIVLNLLSNAVKFTEAGGRVSLSCEAGPATVAVRVRDTGRGIPPEKLGSIFEPFVQVERSLTHAPEGVGLGLAISRELARGMGGDLAVESMPGAGSTFTLTLVRA